jgi:CoA:oxalate CoA-transferase
MESALKGITVIECGHILNGPFAGRILAELGARVIKVEPLGGEFYRHVPIHTMDGESGSFIYFNANKKCITLNLKTSKGRDILRSLVKKCDVFLENFAPGTMEKLGLGYEDIKKIRPEIIYASSTGFGLSGPYKDRPAMDLLVQAMCGLVDINGTEKEPVAIGTFITDYAGGIYTALAILAALFYREQTGTGQHIDVSMFDAGVSLTTQKMLYELEGLGKRLGNSSGTVVPYDIYESSDGHVAIVVSNDEMWKRLAGVIGRSDLADDPRFTTNDARVTSRSQVDSAISSWTSKNDTSEVVNLLLKAGIPCGPVQTLDDLPENPQVKAREMFVNVSHPKIGKVLIPGSVLKMSVTPGTVTQPGLPLGYSNREVFTDMLGYSEEDIATLSREGVI